MPDKKFLLDEELKNLVIEIARDWLQQQERSERLRRPDGFPETSFPIFLVKRTTDLGQNLSGLFDVYGKLGEGQGTETSIGDQLTVYNRMGDYTANKWGIAAEVGSGYELIITECA